ncbi:MAG: hypothetical protein HY063_05875 [Bacteroidetes bacterium]|nr:hypothetical protein [Bacteroidota bacterium]
MQRNKFFLPLVCFLFCIAFFLWTDSAIDPALPLRQTYVSVLLLALCAFFSLKKIPFVFFPLLKKSKALWLLSGYVLVCVLSLLSAKNSSLGIYEASKALLFYLLVLFFCAMCFLYKENFFCRRKIHGGRAALGNFMLCGGFVFFFSERADGTFAAVKYARSASDFSFS